MFEGVLDSVQAFRQGFGLGDCNLGAQWGEIPVYSLGFRVLGLLFLNIRANRYMGRFGATMNMNLSFKPQKCQPLGRGQKAKNTGLGLGFRV